MSYILIQPNPVFLDSQFNITVGTFASASITGATKLKINGRPTATQIQVVTISPNATHTINGTAKFKNNGSGLVKVGDHEGGGIVTVFDAQQTKCKSV